MLNEIHIREATPEDDVAITSLMLTILEEYGLPASLVCGETDIESASREVAGDLARYWVMIHLGAVVGSVALAPATADAGLLKRFYLLPPYRGQGLGRQLYELAENHAREAGYTSIILESSRRFTQARVFYERQGYELVEEIENEWEDNIYRKMLD